MSVFLLDEDLVFPPPHLAVDEGLLAIGGDLSEQRLLLAYSMGIFPWYSEGEPILWWSPDPRLVLFPYEFHTSRRLARSIKRGIYRITFDRAFDRVIRECAQAKRPSQDGTWIRPEMIRAYCRLHQSGFAHSVECWSGTQLAGGLYGVSIGACFFGESMFSAVPDASKVALAALIDRAKQWGFHFIDCQVSSPHLLSLGARELPRADFLRLLQPALKNPTRRGNWEHLQR